MQKQLCYSKFLKKEKNTSNTSPLQKKRTLLLNQWNMLSKLSASSWDYDSNKIFATGTYRILNVSSRTESKEWKSLIGTDI